MRKYLTFVFFITAISGATAQLPIDSIKQLIQTEVAHQRSKSIIVGIVDANGRQIVAAGVKRNNDPSLPDGNTGYEIGSITKLFTSLLLAQMSLNHQLNLTDPISEYLPKEVKTPIRNGKEISLLSLSTHRSGMPRFPYNVDPKDLDQPYIDYTPAKLYEYISNFEPPYDIDTRWRYSNVAYGLLGEILSKVAKKDFEDLIKEEIAGPLKMNHTSIALKQRQLANLAIGHAETGTEVGLTALGAISGGGAVRSTVNDLLTFAQANLGMINTKLYPAMELTHVLRAKKDGDDTFTTMGWTLVDQESGILFKDGGMPGYTAFIGIDRKHKFGVVVLSNTNNSVTDLGRAILEPGRKVVPYRYPWALLDTLRATIANKGVDEAIKLYEQLKSSTHTSFTFNENQLNYLGIELRKDKKIAEAIKIFELNIKAYPELPLVYESLGETYRRNKNVALSLGYFKKAYALDPQNLHLAYLIEKIANELKTD